ncbi:arsenite methyltransferase [Natronobeatus ordinarius]|uniref:arsenite methyltransferase n=1 Tax=Natronobeatus ordinarius TaxID=2963433 RepID=UPI0020CF7F4B|nr:arsenite methyltransferase [Natronobeatus ordinarius]
MTDDDLTQTVACTLTDAEARERADEWLPILGEAFVRADERPGGYTFVFDGIDESLVALARFVADERRCCSFATYCIDVEPPYDETHLTITGPDGTKSLFGEEFVTELESAAGTAGEDPGSRGETPPPASDDEKTPSSGPDDGALGASERRRAVRERYAVVADRSVADERSAPAACSSDAATCCGDATGDVAVDEYSRLLGYAPEDLERVEPGANLGLGCGNPTGIASLSAGDVVLDLGSGAGFDCFLASQEVGEAGRAIGVDMTPAMVETARENAAANEVSNVDFRLGEIEHLPVADASVDVILSNCVLNLSPNKPRVFDEAFRVLRPGGRLAISDVVATASLPTDLRSDPSSVAGCVGGAASVDALESMLHDAGFESIAIEPDEGSEAFIREWDPERDVSDYVAAATIEAEKPVSKSG